MGLVLFVSTVKSYPLSI